MPRLLTSWPGAGINYGHQLGTYTESAIDADLAILKNAGYKYIRVAMPIWNDSSTVTKCRSVALRVLAAGLIPMYGVTSGGPNVTHTQWVAFLGGLTTEATWARDNAIPYFLMGNEDELHIDNTTQLWADCVIDLRAKCAEIKDTVGYTGLVVYSSPNDTVSVQTWTGDAQRGRIDYIGWNMYFDTIFNTQDPIQSWQHKLGVRLAANPGHTMITEWSNINGYQGVTVNSNEKAWQLQLAPMWEILQNSGIPIGCFFAFTDGSFALPTDYWALKLSTGNMRWAWDALKN